MLAAGLLLASLLSTLFPSQDLDLETASLADGPFSRMSMRFEKDVLFFTVEILDLQIRYGHQARDRFRSLLEGKKCWSESLEDEIAGAAISAGDVYVRVQFLRNIDFQRFIEEARSSARLARRSGIIRDSELEPVIENLPIWYSFLRNRGIRKGDEMFYRVQNRSMRTVFISVDGTVYLDQTAEGEGPGRIMIGGYLAPGSSFRKGLIRSLLEGDFRSQDCLRILPPGSDSSRLSP